MAVIKLQSSDGEVFPVNVDVARKSVTIKTMLEELGMEEEKDDVVELANITAPILKKVIEWSTHHKDDPPLPEENKAKIIEISSWDADFLKVEQATLFQLILAANYLEIEGLLEVSCRTVANMIKGKRPEDIRKVFNVKGDLTPTEVEQGRKETE